MQHWLDKLTDLAAIQGDESILTQGLSDLTHHFGFTGYAYLHIQHKHSIAVTNYHREWRSTYFETNFDKARSGRQAREIQKASFCVVQRTRSRKAIEGRARLLCACCRFRHPLRDNRSDQDCQRLDVDVHSSVGNASNRSRP